MNAFQSKKKKKEVEFRNNQAGEAILHIRGLQVLICQGHGEKPKHLSI